MATLVPKQPRSSSALRDQLLRGQDAFAAGRFFEAHEHWEDAWNTLAPPSRDWVQGLIQIAAAHIKVDKGRNDLAASLLRKALPRLEGSPDELETVNLAGMRWLASELLAEVEAEGN